MAFFRENLFFCFVGKSHPNLDKTVAFFPSVSEFTKQEIRNL